MAYKPHNLDVVVDSLKQYSDKDDFYHVTAAALMLICYNSSLVCREGRAEELDGPARPQVEGQGLDRPSRPSAAMSAPGCVLMRKLYGWEYFEKLEKNKPQIGRSINDTVTMLNAKERWVAAGPEATTLLSRDKGNPLAVAYPTDGSLLMVSPSGDSEERAVAQCRQAVHGVPAEQGGRRGPGQEP